MTEIEKLNSLRKTYSFQEPGVVLKNYLELTKVENNLVLEQRNCKSVRKQMLNTNVISANEHIDFVKGLKTKNSGYWAVFRNNEILGTINLVNFNTAKNSITGGNFASQNLIGSGIGVLLNYYMHLIAFEKIDCDILDAVVHKENRNAIRINKAFGAKQINERNTELIQFVNLEFYKKNWLDGIKKTTNNLLKYVE